MIRFFEQSIDFSATGLRERVKGQSILESGTLTLIEVGNYRGSSAFRCAASAIAVLIASTITQGASAQQIPFRSYTQADGLSNAVVTCLEQDETGYILSCGEHGLFAYDGRRFFNLGPSQGLPEGGVVYDIAFSRDRRIVLRYLHRVFVSRDALSLTNSPEALRFDAVSSEFGELDNEQSGQLTAWGGGVVFVGSEKLWYVDLHNPAGKPKLSLLGKVLDQPEPSISNTSALAADEHAVWFTRVNGEICGMSQGSTRCIGTKEGLPALRWLSLKKSPDGHLLARSNLILADVDLERRHASVSSLPFQQSVALVTTRHVPLDFTPSGELLTQSADGLMIRGKSGWKNLNGTNGLPDAPVGSVLFDHQKRLWLGLIGGGVLRAKGYGAWQNWDQRGGITKGLVWQIARQKNGPLWVASDGGVSALVTSNSPLPPHSHFPEPSYAVAGDRFRRVWRSLGANGVTATDVDTGVDRHFQLPAVNQILQGPDDRLWFVTEEGVFVLNNTAVLQNAPSPVAGLTTRVISGALAADGSLWTLSPTGVIHRHNDGSMSTLGFHWPQADFDPLVIAIQPPNILWVGGAGGGLYRLTLAGDRVVGLTQFGSADIRSNSVVSLSIDRRGWVWAGTDSGVSVFNGSLWISATTDDGLIWDDMDQGSVLADDDGSIWLGTSRGLSHLLEPEQLFTRYKLQPVITSVVIGDSPYPGRAVEHTRQPLALQFGVLDAPSDSVVRFRYRLDGVDQAWADTSVGFARYPNLPSGHHSFTVIAYDPLKHLESAPTSIMLRMKVPTWARWPFVVVYAALLLFSLYGLLRLRVRMLLRQRKHLQQEVTRQTQRIRDAQAALFLQATQDGLTKLLTRSEIQRRVDELIESMVATAEVTIGLLDVDHFKRINDAHGHLAGDEVLRELGKRLIAELEPGEYAGRYGGEEILLVLSSGSKSGIYRMHELKSAAFDHVFTLGTYMIDVTCSIGVTQAQVQDNWTSLIGRADRALYDAKQNGRNKVVDFIEIGK